MLAAAIETAEGSYLFIFSNSKCDCLITRSFEMKIKIENRFCIGGYMSLNNTRKTRFLHFLVYFKHISVCLCSEFRNFQYHFSFDPLLWTGTGPVCLTRLWGYRKPDVLCFGHKCTIYIVYLYVHISSGRTDLIGSKLN